MAPKANPGPPPPGSSSIGRRDMSASLNSILSVAKTGLLSQQLALQVTSHNLANATTEGYSRQRAELVPGTPLQLPEGLLGTGVRVADITRARDQLLDGIYRRESALFHGFQTEYQALATVESVFGEVGVAGLADTLDSFWNAWSDLSNDPTSAAARSVVVGSGQAIVDHFRRVDGALDSFIGQEVDRLRNSVAQVNEVIEQVAGLNAEIAAARAGGNSAPDLEDRRDVLLDQLSSYVPIEVTRRDSGAVGVSVNGISVVEGVTHRTLNLASAAGVWSVATSGGLAVPLSSGRIGGSLEVINDDFTRFRTQLDALAQGLVERVNAIHVNGTNPLGGTGLDFFDDLGDPTTVTAATLSLDAAVLADPLNVAAGSPDGGGNYQAGANDIALSLAALRTAAAGGVLGASSINGAYRDLVADVGLTTAAARDAADNHSVLMSSAGERRESVAGVATDEELVKVVQLQAAFAAASRIVTVVDEMYQTLLAI